MVPAGGSATFDTGVHMELPNVQIVHSIEKGEEPPLTLNIKNYIFTTAAFLKSKSGLMVNHDITSDGTVDYGYTGSIKVKLFNHGTEDYHVRQGDKISQLVIVPVLTPTLQVVDELDETERGDNGFGSTGR